MTPTKNKPVAILVDWKYSLNIPVRFSIRTNHRVIDYYYSFLPFIINIKEHNNILQYCNTNILNFMKYNYLASSSLTILSNFIIIFRGEKTLAQAYFVNDSFHYNTSLSKSFLLHLFFDCLAKQFLFIFNF